MKKILFITVVSLLLTLPGPIEMPAAAYHDVAIATSTERYVRTELYFGQSKPDGSQIPEPEWQKFVDEFVTPRFPNGLTIVEADGQWRSKDAKIVREKSKILILLYARKDRKAADAKIEELRTEYKKRFNQESVLRLDFKKFVNVAF